MKKKNLKKRLVGFFFFFKYIYTPRTKEYIINCHIRRCRYILSSFICKRTNAHSLDDDNNNNNNEDDDDDDDNNKKKDDVLFR